MLGNPSLRTSFVGAIIIFCAFGKSEVSINLKLCLKFYGYFAYGSI